MNNTDVPEQTGFTDAPKDTLTNRFGFTDIRIELDVAGLPLAQVRSEVSKQVTWSLFAGI